MWITLEFGQNPPKRFSQTPIFLNQPTAVSANADRFLKNLWEQYREKTFLRGKELYFPKNLTRKVFTAEV